MKSPSRQAGKLRARELCLLALFGALMFVTKLVLAALPNIHLNAVFIIVAAVLFSWRAIYAALVYIMLEGLFFGFGIWWLNYLYIWPIFTLLCLFLRKNDSALIWAVTAAVFGLGFGALCSIPYFFIGGPQLAFSYWLSGIPFDLSHCAGNFLVTLLLYRPLSTAANKLMKL